LAVHALRENKKQKCGLRSLTFRNQGIKLARNSDDVLDHSFPVNKLRYAVEKQATTDC